MKDSFPIMGYIVEMGVPRTRCPKCFRQTASASIQVEVVSKNRMKIGELRSCSSHGSVE